MKNPNSNLMKFSFVLGPELSSGKCPIRLKLVQQGKRKHINLNQKGIPLIIDKDHWTGGRSNLLKLGRKASTNDKPYRVLIKYPESRNINPVLDSIEYKVQDILYTLAGQNIPITIDLVVKQLSGDNSPFWNLFENFLKAKKEEGKNMHFYKLLEQALKRYEATTEKIILQYIESSFMRKFDNFLATDIRPARGKPYGDNTRKTLNACFRAFLNVCYNRGVVPTEDYKNYKISRVDGHKFALTINEVIAFNSVTKNSKGQPIPSGWEYDQKIFTFLCFSGLRMAEWNWLRTKVFSDEYQKILRNSTQNANFDVSTGDIILIKTHKQRQERYRYIPLIGLSKEIYDEYILDWNKDKRGLPSITARVSRNIRTIATLAGIASDRVEKLTPNIGRHTLNTWLLSEGLEKKEARDVMGHRSEAANRIYEHGLIEKYINEAAQALKSIQAM